MSQPDERSEDGAGQVVPDQQVAERNGEAPEDDVEGHVYTGALQDKNQQP